MNLGQYIANTLLEQDKQTIAIFPGAFKPPHRGHFEVVKKLLTIYKKTIYICGLDGDYKQEQFVSSRIFDLIPYASTLTKLNSRCSICNNIAPFTKRRNNSNIQILIGGALEYKPVCLNHLYD